MTAKIYVDGLDDGWVFQDDGYVAAFRNDEDMKAAWGDTMFRMIDDVINKSVEIGPAVDVHITITPRKSKLNTK